MGPGLGPAMHQIKICFKDTTKDGDIIDMRVYRVPKSPQNPEGISFNGVYKR